MSRDEMRDMVYNGIENVLDRIKDEMVEKDELDMLDEVFVEVLKEDFEVAF